MILSVVRASWLALRRDRGAWVLSFVLPIAFFSVFALVFGEQRRQGAPVVALAVVDEDQSDFSARLLAGLRHEKGLRVSTAAASHDAGAVVPYDRSTAEAAVRAGEFQVALVLPRGLGASPLGIGPSAPSERIILLHDSADPIAPEIVTGLLQRVALRAAPDALVEQGVRYLDATSGGLSGPQRARVNEDLARIRERGRQQHSEDGEGMANLVPVERRDVVGAAKKNPFVAFYAAGIGVLFLLFSATSAGGSLLEDSESGTLERVLATRVSMGALLAGKLVYTTLLALAQLTVMFTWGALVFHLEFFTHLQGFFAIAAPTAVASAAFGLVLATACRTRAQLTALSRLVVLIVSAVGGSMFPRFLMPEQLQRLSLFAFNAWALDGFTKVFWREESVSHLWPQIAFLLANAAAFFVIARRLARRWDVA